MRECSPESSPEAEHFNVLVAFDEPHNAQRAEMLLRRMLDALGPDDGHWLQWTKWNYTNPDFLTAAAAADKAEASDAILIVSKETEEVPLLIGCWIDRWSIGNVGKKGLAVALLESPEDLQKPGAIFQYLKAATLGREYVFFAALTRPFSKTVALHMPDEGLTVGAHVNPMEVAAAPSSNEPHHVFA